MRSSFTGSSMRIAVALAAISFAAACGRSTTGLQHREAARIEITDRSLAERPVVATWIRGSGWQANSQLPTISHSSATPGRISIGVLMYNEDDQAIALSETGEYQAIWRAHSTSPTGLLVNDDSAGDRFHGDLLHIHATPGQTGTARVEIIQWHGSHPSGHSEVLTPPIDVIVTN